MRREATTKIDNEKKINNKEEKKTELKKNCYEKKN